MSAVLVSHALFIPLFPDEEPEDDEAVTLRDARSVRPRPDRRRRLIRLGRGDLIQLRANVTR